MAAIISASDLSKIQSQVSTAGKVDARLQERQYLKELSDARSQKWPNTIQAQRARKEKKRQERLEAEEEDRKAIDAMEAKLKAEARQLQIERANKMLYDETDKVKAFHSSLLLSDVIKEREAQIEYKKRIHKEKKRHDLMFTKEQERALEIAEAAEARKWEERRSRALQERDTQLEQLEELRNKILREKEENMQEGTILRAKAEEEVRMLQEKEEARRRRACEANTETIKANNALRAFRELEELREKEADKKIMEFATEKERMILARQQREQEKAREKEAQRDKMIAVMEGDLLRRRSKAEQRTQNQEEEARIAEDAREADRLAQRKAEMVAIDRSRQQQLEIRSMKKTRQKQEEEAFVAQWKERNEQLKVEEEMEKIQAFKRNKKLQDAHFRQMEKKRQRAEAQKIREMQDAMATRLVMQEDEELFKHYTTVCCEEWAKQGKSLTPMLLEISKKEKLATQRK